MGDLLERCLERLILLGDRLAIQGNNAFLVEAQALLLDVPEALDTPRLALRATRAGAGAQINAAFVESRDELRPWMPWARNPMTVEQSEEHCRTMLARWHAEPFHVTATYTYTRAEKYVSKIEKEEAHYAQLTPSGQLGNQ